MRRLHVIAWSVLAASLVANGYLLASRTTPTTSSPTAHVVSQSAARRARVTRAPLPRPATPTEVAALAREELEARLTAVEARIHELRDPSERFADGEPNPELEARMRPVFDRVFQVKAGEPANYRFECRADTCKVAPTKHNDDWVDRIQSLPESEWFPRKLFTGPGAYVTVAEPSEGAGRWLAIAVRAAASEAAMTCARTIEAKGVLEVQLHLDASTRRVTALLGGELAEHEMARCIQRAYDDAIARTPVPPEATQIVGEPLVLTFPLPSDD